MALLFVVGSCEAYSVGRSTLTSSHTMRSPSTGMLIKPGDIKGEDFRHGTGRPGLRQMGGTDPLALEVEQTAPMNYATYGTADDFRFGKGSVAPTAYGGTAPIGQVPAQGAASTRQASMGSDNFRFGTGSGVSVTRAAPLGGTTGAEAAKKVRAGPALGTVDDFRFGRGSVAAPTSYGGA